MIFIVMIMVAFFPLLRDMATFMFWELDSVHQRHSLDFFFRY